MHSSLIVFASIQRDIVSYFSISSSTSSLLIGKFCTFWTMSLIVDRFIPSSWDFNALVVLKDFIINNLFQDNNMYRDFLLQTILTSIYPSSRDWLKYIGFFPHPVSLDFIGEMGVVLYLLSSSYHATLPFDFLSRKKQTSRNSQLLQYIPIQNQVHKLIFVIDRNEIVQLRRLELELLSINRQFPRVLWVDSLINKVRREATLEMVPLE